MLDLFRALRPKQWAKNSFCLAPLIFARRATEADSVGESAMVFVAFSLLASAVYLINDVIDRDRDRAHPVKSKRPIASGAVGPSLALVAASVLGAGAMAIAWRLSDLHGSWLLVGVLAGYLVLNVGYTFWLKHVVLVDLFTIAIGFVLRVEAGAAAIEVTASRWILTCTFFIALLIAACKRRSEVELQGTERGTRAVLTAYSVSYLDTIITVVAAGAILSYALYAMSPTASENLGTAELIYTLPFVIFAIFRYIYLVRERARGENPFELLVGDAPMIVNLGGYTVVTVVLLYGR
jgi:4-hydroxybenzoate polyprenyltransferase